MLCYLCILLYEISVNDSALSTPILSLKFQLIYCFALSKADQTLLA